MIYFANTLGHLRDAVNNLIEAVGENAPVGCTRSYDQEYTVTLVTQEDLTKGTKGEKIVAPPGEYLGDQVQLDWVVIEPELGRVVGDEAEDYELRKKPGELNAIRIS